VDCYSGPNVAFLNFFHFGRGGGKDDSRNGKNDGPRIPKKLAVSRKKLVRISASGLRYASLRCEIYFSNRAGELPGQKLIFLAVDYMEKSITTASLASKLWGFAGLWGRQFYGMQCMKNLLLIPWIGPNVGTLPLLGGSVRLLSPRGTREYRQALE
jgi:hypothetical protein